ncbi:MAG: F0F1 ATP synthase subunit alpha [Candidatus Omnitrophota bacterium]
MLDKSIFKDLKFDSLEFKDVGVVHEAKKGLISVKGLADCASGQIVDIKDTLQGMVMGFTEDEVMVLVLGDETGIKLGDTVTSRRELFKIPVGENFIGRIVNSLALPCDGKEEIKEDDYLLVFNQAAGVMERTPITEPLLTGIKVCDTMIPIGKGQRELVIGDRVTGKSALAIDMILNQKDKNVICIYCWIGGSTSSLFKILEPLEKKSAMEYSIILAAPASTPVSYQYLAPYTACTLGEYFMKRGRDVLIIYDDLTKHAWIYRQLSLLLERSPGRQAYPGDMFYVHAQLMERAGRLSPDNGGGTMTAFPIVETQQGDVTAYIPSNLISMTDGQIHLSTSLFQKGFKPAVFIGLSVSRIGSKVQSDALKEMSRTLRLEYAQFIELVRLTKLRTRTAPEVANKMKRGSCLTTLFTQDVHNPISVEEIVILFYAFHKGILEMLSKEMLLRFQGGVFDYLKLTHPKIITELAAVKILTKELKHKLDQAFISYLEEEKIVE